MVAGARQSPIALTATGVLEYSPRDNWFIKATANYQARSSNQPLYAYGDDFFTLGVLYKIH
jgi:hypothetical protein